MKNNQSNISSRQYDIGPETRIDIRKSGLKVSEEQMRGEYEVGSATQGKEQEPTPTEAEIEVDTQRYGIGKPRRETIRGKLSND